MKYLGLVLVGVLLVMCLVAATPTPMPVVSPAAPDLGAAIEATPVGQSLPDILQQIAVVLLVPGFAVLLGNLSKLLPFMKWMDGKTDKVVAVLTTILFGVAVFLNLFDATLFSKVMPWFLSHFEEYVGYINIAIGWIISIIAIPAIHDLLAGKFIVGKSFSAPAK